jgi:hypothetical protein
VVSCSNKVPYAFKESRCGNVSMTTVMLFCLFVVAHMLGVPVTLRHPVEAADTMGASVLEGFPVHPAVPRLTLPSKTIPVADAQSSMQVPVLVFALFPPPLKVRFIAPYLSRTPAAWKSGRRLLFPLVGHGPSE